MKKRVVVVSDFHCGHNVGLTPPTWQYRKKTKGSTKRNKWGQTQHDLWQNFVKILKSIDGYDICLFLGDAIDGKGMRGGCVETITGSMYEQCDMAVKVFDTMRLYANKGFQIHGVYGTDYHVSIDGEDAEDVIAERAGFASIGGHNWIDVNGCIFDIKHKIGSSGIPHGRFTAVAKEMLWAQQWAIREQAPMPNVVLRGHAHYYAQASGTDWMTMICPALQGMGSKFGIRQCSGLVDWGLMHFDIGNKGEILDHQVHTVKIDSQTAKAVKA